MTRNEPTPRRRGRPPLEDVEGRMLRAVEELLAEGHAFSSLSVQTLARRAGIARATFYLHFRDKSALVARLLTRISDEIVAGNRGWFADAHGAGPREVRAALHGVVRVFKKHHAVLAAVSETATFDVEVRARRDEMMARLCLASRGAVATVRAEGRAAPGADDAMADTLTWMVALYCTQFLRRRSGQKVESVVDTLSKLCVAAIFGASSTA